MAFTMTRAGERFIAAAVCDRCGGRAAAGGYALYDLARRESDAGPMTCLLACGDDCADVLTSPYESPDADWVAIQIDAYLANLVTTLAIDVPRVLERERAGSAAIHTRDESPD